MLSSTPDILSRSEFLFLINLNFKEFFYEGRIASLIILLINNVCF